MVAMVGPSRPERLAQLSAALGFAVARTPERLDANPKDHPRHAKRALNFLLDDRSDQIEDRWSRNDRR